MKVLIVGGGPSGVSAGLWLLKKGIKPILFEKRTFPRDKLCGGLITPKGREELSLLNISYNHIAFEPPYINISDGADLNLRFKNDIGIQLIKREQFDDLLIDEYVKRGGILKENQEITDINTDKKYIINAQGQEYFYDVLVIGEGAGGRLRKRLNQTKLQNALCLEHKKKDEFSCDDEKSINVYFLDDKPGYAWRFENRDETVTGIGSLLDYTDLKNKFNNIFGEAGKLKGAFVPYGIQPSQSNIQDVYFVGDAGGYVNSLLGEGISYGIASGRALVDIIVNKDNSLDCVLRKNLRFYLSLRNLFFSKSLSKLNINLLKKYEEFAIFICKEFILRSDFSVYGYKKLLQHFWRYKIGR
jgi:flavin-dependent dehydrogenase